MITKPFYTGKYIVSSGLGKQKLLVHIIKDIEGTKYWYYNIDTKVYDMSEWDFDDWRKIDE